MGDDAILVCFVFQWKCLFLTLYISFLAFFFLLSLLKLFYLLSVIHVKTSSTYRLFTLLALNLWIGCSFLFHLGALYVCVRLCVCFRATNRLIRLHFMCLCQCVRLVTYYIRYASGLCRKFFALAEERREPNVFKTMSENYPKTPNVAKLNRWSMDPRCFFPPDATGNPDLYSLVRFRRIIKSRSVCFS